MFNNYQEDFRRNLFNKINYLEIKNIYYLSRKK